MVSWEAWAKKVAYDLTNLFENDKKLEKQINELDGSLNTLNMRFDSFLNDFREFRKKVTPLLTQHYKCQIVDLLSKELRPRSLRWIQHRIGVYPFHLLLQLEDVGLIEHTKSGTHNMYAIKKEVEQ